MKIVHVKPINNHVILHPVSFARIPPEGDNVEYSDYWYRREAEGGVVISEIKADEPEPTKTNPPKEAVSNNKEESK